MDLTDKFNKLGDKLKAKNYLYNAVQTVINTTAKNDNTAMILKTIFYDLKLDNDEYNTTEVRMNLLKL